MTVYVHNAVSVEDSSYLSSENSCYKVYPAILLNTNYTFQNKGVFSRDSGFLVGGLINSFVQSGFRIYRKGLGFWDIEEAHIQLVSPLTFAGVYKTVSRRVNSG